MKWLETRLLCMFAPSTLTSPNTSAHSENRKKNEEMILENKGYTDNQVLCRTDRPTNKQFVLMCSGEQIEERDPRTNNVVSNLQCGVMR